MATNANPADDAAFWKNCRRSRLVGSSSAKLFACKEDDFMDVGVCLGHVKALVEEAFRSKLKVVKWSKSFMVMFFKCECQFVTLLIVSIGNCFWKDDMIQFQRGIAHITMTQVGQLIHLFRISTLP